MRRYRQRRSKATSLQKSPPSPSDSSFVYHRECRERMKFRIERTYMNRLLLAVLFLSSAALAQDASTALRPPKGSPVAIVVFEDLQCPMCRRDAPLVAQAGKTYRIPVVRHDFPLPMHNWSYQAAVFARYFDTHSKQLGNDYRDYIFEHQMEIFPGNLRGFTEKFAADHKVDLPFAVDPQGALAAEVNADRDLGQRIGINHTPTIYVVSNKPNKPFAEVTDVSQLYQMIDAAKAN
jgi:protein-disulfide isomerase